MSNFSDPCAQHGLPPRPHTARLVAGAATWLLLVVIPWLGVAVMYSLLVFPLLPIALLSTLVYLVLTVRGAGRPLPGILGGVVLAAGLFWTEWAAFMTADRLAGMMVAASRGRDIHLEVAGPVTLSLIGVLLFYIGMTLIRPPRGGTSAPWETLALALICPVVAFMVRLDALPLTT